MLDWLAGWLAGQTIIPRRREAIKMSKDRCCHGHNDGFRTGITTKNRTQTKQKQLKTDHLCKQADEDLFPVFLKKKTKKTNRTV